MVVNLVVMITFLYHFNQTLELVFLFFNQNTKLILTLDLDLGPRSTGTKFSTGVFKIMGNRIFTVDLNHNSRYSPG